MFVSNYLPSFGFQLVEPYDNDYNICDVDGMPMGKKK
tara:strand:- start:165 stop:275 length:111 start_codon:yes stop_codon:yes gene_type:complete